MDHDTIPDAAPVRERLLEAALECFLADEYHRVTTRQIAARAGANVSMIRYYFGGKEGLYEEMIRGTLAPLIELFDSPMLGSTGGFADFFRLYYRVMSRHPRFPRLILKVLALNQGPGRRFIRRLLEQGRSRGARKVAALKAKGELEPTLNPDVLRMSFVSLAITPMLLKELFEEQLGHALDGAFLEQLAELNGRLFAAGLARAEKGMYPASTEGERHGETGT